MEEMLINRALKVMRVYIKPGGQRGYDAGHCINLPQKVEELANTLPHYPKEVSVIVVKMHGKDNTFKDVFVRRHKVENALRWLILNNPLYKDIQIDTLALNSLPVNSIPNDLLSVETDVPHDGVDPENINNIGEPHNSDDHSNEDIVYNKDSEMSSFLQSPEAEQQEEDAILEQLQNQIMDWPSIENEPLSEFTTPFLATLSFPTLFSDSDGDPTNPAILREVSFKGSVLC